RRSRGAAHRTAHRRDQLAAPDGRHGRRDAGHHAAPRPPRVLGRRLDPGALARLLAVLAVARARPGQVGIRFRAPVRGRLNTMTPLDVADWRRRVFALYE